MDIPYELARWVVAYRSLSQNRVQFFLRDFPVESVTIKVTGKATSRRFAADIFYTDDEGNGTTVFLNNISSITPEEVMFRSLKRFIETEFIHSSSDFLRLDSGGEDRDLPPPTRRTPSGGAKSPDTTGE